MPGFIKVSNSQRPVGSAYVKVSGTWKPALKAYVKVAGTWQQWYSANVVDTFDRSNASSLGTCSNGVASWTSTSGSWAISSNKATTSTGASSYPLATITSTLGLNDLEVGVDIPTGAGQGVAFWVTNSSNWWAVVTDYVTTANYSCPSGGTLSGTDCIVTSTYSATATANYSAYTQNCTSTTTTYTSASQDVYGTCNYPYQPCGPDSLGRCSGGYCYSNPATYTTCPSGYTYNGTNCERSISTSICCSGTWDGTGCYTGTTYSCASGDTLSGTTCTHSSSYAATNTPSYTYFTRIIQKASGTVSTVASFSHTSPVRSLKVVTANNDITVSAYSAAGQDGLLGVNSFTAISPTKTAVAGLVLSPANSSQGTTFDTFYIK